MNKLQKILSGFVLVQLALVVAVFWPRGAGAVSEAGPLLTNIGADDIQRMTIADDTGASIELVRQGEGWVLPSADDFPANGERVAEILGKMAGIQNGRLIAQTEASHKRLQVADDAFLRRVSLTRSDGTVETLFVGSSPNAQGTHVRRSGEDETYLTGSIQSWELNPLLSSWIDTSYMALTTGDVQRVVVENGNGRLEFARVSDTEWELAGLNAADVFNQTAFTTLLNRLANLRMTTPLGKVAEAGYGLNAPQATVTIMTNDDTVTLTVGAKNDETDTYTAKYSGSDYYVTISSFSLEQLTTATLDDFVQQPTPAAEEAPSP
ncbi:MAG: DUF4340 domain-containing protein [Ardenticatenaceae bacterium]|nr:DUF4340 domain-containing protein [Ardenticatenaceae bacterium]